MLKMNRCLRRLIGSRSVFRNLKTTCVSNNGLLIPTAAKAFFCSDSLGYHTGLASEFIENPRNIYCQSEEAEGRCDRDIDNLACEENVKIIEKGNFVNLSQILFTKDRDYLVRYTDPQLVTADQLADKVVVLYFVRQDPYSSSSRNATSMTSLIDVYNDLKHTNSFEIVFIYVHDLFATINGELSSYSFLQSESQIFEAIFCRMPWTAIPFSDKNSRKYLEEIFGLRKVHTLNHPVGIVVDARGMVLQTSCEHIIDKYGSPAFPFSDERLAFIDSEDDVVAKHLSLKTILASPERDYVISNKEEKVPIHTLEDKVVALYFYEDVTHSYTLTKELKTAYEELAKNNEKFEVVLIYLTDTNDTYKCTNEETYKNTFKTMPWLALPFKDTIHKKLKRLFDYPAVYSNLQKEAPRLVIFGPHGGFIEPCGAEVLSKFGVSAYPFTREYLVKLVTEKVMELNLEMLCSPTAVFKRKDGSQVQFSDLMRKRVVFYFESVYWDHLQKLATLQEEVRFLPMLKEVEFLNMLKERYLQMKGTDEEFEVIYIPDCQFDDEFCYNELVAGVPWFVSPLSQLLPGGIDLLTYYGKMYYQYGWSFLLAFGLDGRLVRRTIYPKFKHMDFPFCACSLEDEAYHKLSRHVFSYGYWNMYYQGLLRNSFETN